mgnify:CR=1 FL=1
MNNITEEMIEEALDSILDCNDPGVKHGEHLFVKTPNVTAIQTRRRI